MKTKVVFAYCVALTVAGCGQKYHAAEQEPTDLCVAEQLEDGARIKCVGSEAVINDGATGETVVGEKGQDGTSCTVDATGLVTCGSSSYQIPAPVNGVDGVDGINGVDGLPGESCSVSDTGLVTCGDTTYQIPSPQIVQPVKVTFTQLERNHNKDLCTKVSLSGSGGQRDLGCVDEPALPQTVISQLYFEGDCQQLTFYSKIPGELNVNSNKHPQNYALTETGIAVEDLLGVADFDDAFVDITADRGSLEYIYQGTRLYICLVE